MELKLVALFIALAVLSGCITPPGGCESGVSYEIPVGWEKFSENDSAINFTRIGMDPIESPLITISKTKGFNGVEYEELEDFVDGFLAAISAQEEVRTSLGLYGKLGSLDVVTQTVLFNTGNANPTLRFMVTEKSNGYFHIISLVSDEDAFEQDKAAFEKISDSFKIGCD